MSIVDLYIDYNIETAPDGHKHYREGWINIECPHCAGSQGYHLGFNIYGGYFYCWRCGAHNIEKTLSKLLSIDYNPAVATIIEYNLHRKGGDLRKDVDGSIRIGKKKFKLPSGVGKMGTPHRNYLRKRGFDPGYIEQNWGVLGTSPMSRLNDIPYRFRILIPFYWGNQIVSFQCRDYTDKQELKYMACPMEREILHHKHILYGEQKMWGDVGICVEGVLDVWRLESSSFAVLGVGYTKEQVRLISQLFKKIFILFDPEPQAQQQAKKLQQELLFRGVETYVYTDLPSDPADLSQDDVDHLLKELKLDSGVTSDSSS